MSDPSASPPTHHSRHAAVAIVVALLALYFLAPWFLLWPFKKAQAEGFITEATEVRVDVTVLAPVRWVVDRSRPYRDILRAEWDLCEKVLGDPRYP